MFSTLSNNLPLYVTPILGREREIGEVGALLSKHQLVAIVGAGGIGKTRVAVEVAGGLTDAMYDGVWFVDLAPLADAALVASTVANVVGLRYGDAADPAALVAALVAALERRKMLLLLDNCEHVVLGAAELASAIVESCPQMRVLATSREPLACAHETTYRLDTLDEASAANLFVTRMQLADRRFAPSSGDLELIAEICKHLDGIALAIELAAARARFMPLAELLARLDERFRLLTREAGATPTRHATLRALFDWSYELLSEQEQAVFRRLGTFTGGFTVESAIRVAGEDEHVDAAALLDRISSLLDKSMLVRVHGRERYGMLETIREYARDRLRRAGDEERARHAHASVFDETSAAAARTFGIESEDSWLARYELELDNFRSALDWTLPTEPAVAARTIANLKEFWNYGNVVAEGLTRARAVYDAVAPLGNDRALLDAELAIGYLLGRAQEYRRSLESAERALALALRLGDASATAVARRIAGSALFVLGDATRAAEELRSALEFFASHGEPVRALHAQSEYAWVLLQTDPPRGRALMLEALASAEALNWPRAQAHMTIRLAESEFHSGDLAAAVERARGAVEACRRRNSTERLAHALCNLCSYLSVAGAYGEARQAGEEGATIALAHGLPALVEYILQSLAIGKADRGDPLGAARLLGHVNAFMSEIGYERERTEAMVHERLLELTSRRLDAAEMATALAAGRDTTIDEALAFALDDAPAIE